ncbi:hypothetical protein EB796_018872 [Bugula neritina]|uniref:Uncharacterized protein n=1 Tax=Bugula neritina TaxID=10212 RepID=A0A7J7JBU8_BUGNE|nr:hypothetical protein EB796_018872 [Bugula neritina]
MTKNYETLEQEIPPTQGHVEIHEDNPTHAKRFEIKLLAGKLEEILKNCSVFHQFISKEFPSHKEISLETLEGLRTQLIEEKANVIKAYEQLREACGDLEPDLKIRNQIDRVGADNENFLKLLYQTNQAHHQLLLCLNHVTQPIKNCIFYYSFQPIIHTFVWLCVAVMTLEEDSVQLS